MLGKTSPVSVQMGDCARATICGRLAAFYAQGLCGRLASYTALEELRRRAFVLRWPAMCSLLLTLGHNEAPDALS